MMASGRGSGNAMDPRKQNAPRPAAGAAPTQRIRFEIGIAAQRFFTRENFVTKCGALYGVMWSAPPLGEAEAVNGV